MRTKTNNNFFNAVNDITEKDIARQRYYQLMNEQSWWNIQRRINYNKKMHEHKAKVYAGTIILILLVIMVACFIIHDAFSKR